MEGLAPLNRVWKNVLRTAFCALLFYLFAAPSIGFAVEPVILSPEKDRYQVGRYLEEAQDKSGEITFEQVREPSFAGRFRPNVNRGIHVGHTTSAWWFRFKLDRVKQPLGSYSTYTKKWFIEFSKPGILKIDLHIPVRTPDGPEWIVRKTGEGRPLKARDVCFRSFVLELPDNFRSDDYFYIRIRTVISMNMDVRIWSASALTSHAAWDNLGFGLIYGVMLSMAVYNLMLLFFLGDRVYLHYVLYIIAMLINHTILYGQAAVLCDFSPEVFQKLRWISLGNTWLWGSLFGRSFLNLRVNAPKMDKLIICLAIVSGVMMLTGLMGFGRVTNMLSNSISPIGGILGITSAIVCLRRGFRPALFYLIAWFPLLVGVVLYSVGGVLVERNFLTIYTLTIGTALEALLLSFALAHRIRVLKEEKQTLEKSERRLTELTVRDGLTELYNKRYLDGKLAGELKTSRILGKPLSVLMMDLDDFKKWNDTYGHLSGDEVLTGLARIIQGCSRYCDTPARFGGEEFMLILPGTPIGEARIVAERIRSTLEKCMFNPRPGIHAGVTVSIGVAEAEPEEEGDALVHRADEAMYVAKKKGKNRVAVSSPHQPSRAADPYHPDGSLDKQTM